MVHKIVLCMALVLGLVACDGTMTPPTQGTASAPTLHMAQPGLELADPLDLTGAWGCSLGINFGGMVGDLYAPLTITQDGDSITAEFNDPPPFTGVMDTQGTTLKSENSAELNLVSIKSDVITGFGQIRGTSDNKLYPIDFYCARK